MALGLDDRELLSLEEVTEAIVRGGKARLRPVLLTAGTTMLGNLIITLDPVFSGLALAIIFASPGGEILAIEAGHPNSTRRIRSPDAIQYVLEINYAEADQLRIGDRFALRLIPQ